MFKQIIKKCNKWIIWSSMITILLCIVAVVITFFTTSNREDFWSLAMFCGAFVFTAGLAFITEILDVMCFDDVCLVNEEIQIKRNRRGEKLLTIPYTQITAIRIDGMQGHANYGTVHKKGIPQSCMSIFYTEDVTPKIYCRSKSKTPPYDKSFDGWYAYPLNTNHLEVLLNKTNAFVYISEQILKSHTDELKEILDSFSDRVTVAYYDIIEREEKEAPYTVVKDWF